MVANRTRKPKRTWYVPSPLRPEHVSGSRDICVRHINVLGVFQGMQLSSMKGDLLSVDYESSEEGEMEEEEEEEERVVVSATSKTK